MKTKICTNKKCLKEKPLSEFYKDKSTTNGYSPRCKDCIKIKSKEHYLKNKKELNKKSKNYKIIHKKDISIYNKNYRKQNLKEIKNYDKIRYQKNKKSINLSNKKYKDKHKQELSMKANIYTKKKRKIDMGFRVLCNMRTRLSQALKLNSKTLSTMFLIGCEIDYLMYHIQNKFTKGMSWDNYGIGGWEMDHIKPCTSFDLSDPKQQKLCFHYSNLQPLWAGINRSKSNKY